MVAVTCGLRKVKQNLPSETQLNTGTHGISLAHFRPNATARIICVDYYCGVVMLIGFGQDQPPLQQGHSEGGDGRLSQYAET